MVNWFSIAQHVVQACARKAITAGIWDIPSLHKLYAVTKPSLSGPYSEIVFTEFMLHKIMLGVRSLTTVTPTLASSLNFDTKIACIS